MGKFFNANDNSRKCFEPLKQKIINRLISAAFMELFAKMRTERGSVKYICCLCKKRIPTKLFNFHLRNYHEEWYWFFLDGIDDISHSDFDYGNDRLSIVYNRFRN